MGVIKHLFLLLTVASTIFTICIAQDESGSAEDPSSSSGQDSSDSSAERRPHHFPFFNIFGHGDNDGGLFANFPRFPHFRPFGEDGFRFPHFPPPPFFGRPFGPHRPHHPHHQQNSSESSSSSSEGDASTTFAPSSSESSTFAPNSAENTSSAPNSTENTSFAPSSAESTTFAPLFNNLRRRRAASYSTESDDGFDSFEADRKRRQAVPETKSVAPLVIPDINELKVDVLLGSSGDLTKEAEEAYRQLNISSGGSSGSGSHSGGSGSKSGGSSSSEGDNSENHSNSLESTSRVPLPIPEPAQSQ